MRKAPSLAGRAVLAIALMIGFYLLALGICTGLGLLVYESLQSRHVNGRLLVSCAITVGVVLWSVVPRPARFPDPGVRLREPDQPELFRLIQSVAKDVGQAPPAEVFLVGDVNAFVAERGSVLGLGGTRIMGLGLPLLQVLTTRQLRSVIAHEFGHFHGGDTRLGPFIYRTREAIGRTVVNFHRAQSLLQKPFEWYGKLFLRVTFSISRQQEFAADALAVQIVGLEPMQSALRRVNEVSELYDRYLQTEFLPVLNRNVRPPIAEGFGLFLSSKAVQELQVQIREQAMQAKGNPYDSHPPLSERLATAAEVEHPGTGNSAGPLAISLLHDLPTLEGELLAFLVGKAEVKKVPAGTWREAMAAALAGTWNAAAEQQGSKLPAMAVAELTAQGPLLEHHALLLDRKVPAAERRMFGAWLFGCLLARALLRAGFAIEASPGDPVVMVRGEQGIEPFAIAESMAAGKLTEAAWQQTCAAHGIGGLVLAGPVLGAEA
ncbi:MAG TPA: M48 family metallopeptidase [Planctomycetota bacterium]|nr:M48 family metallopeptidase [Planctomycetota bacterium]